MLPSALKVQDMPYFNVEGNMVVGENRSLGSVQAAFSGPIVYLFAAHNSPAFGKYLEFREGVRFPDRSKQKIWDLGISPIRRFGSSAAQNNPKPITAAS